VESPELQVYDPASGKDVWIWYRSTRAKDGPFFHCFWRMSDDAGRSWGPLKLLRYEAGDDFNPEHAANPRFLKNNQSYMGQSIIRCRDGSLVFSAAEVNVDEPISVINPKGIRTWDKPIDARSIGACCFIARWNVTKKYYDWEAGKPVWLPRHVSSRGLAEPDLVELKDGRILVVFRGSNSGLNQAQAPGRKWFSLSNDGGKTLSPPKELKYDDGSSFYSASSIHALFRDKNSGKLYWIGNISITPPDGNSPRYPLVIAEVDESIPALRRSTVTLIDDRRKGDGKDLQLSNFSLVQKRDSGALVIYLTRLGENPDDFWGADAYKYTLEFQ
ncbi:MAG: exo-alpha-sialidase, partial [Pirellulales bacterium]|nr:exo-alpha-sialidase [Pirellulales bacterium]